MYFKKVSGTFQESLGELRKDFRGVSSSFKWLTERVQRDFEGTESVLRRY